MKIGMTQLIVLSIFICVLRTDMIRGNMLRFILMQYVILLGAIGAIELYVDRNRDGSGALLENCAADCDNDIGCEGDLLCWQRDDGDMTPIPGCTGDLSVLDNAGYPGWDYCYSPLGLYEYVGAGWCVEGDDPNVDNSGHFNRVRFNDITDAAECSQQCAQFVDNEYHVGFSHSASLECIGLFI